MQNIQNREKTESLRVYATRRVNPFLGVMQIVEAEEGRALSCNGVVWEILVRATRGSTRGGLDQIDKKKTYFRFGMWSNNDGLMKRASSPAADQDYFELASKCEKLVEHVREHQCQLPFHLEDNIELWLFGSNTQQPLALLSSLIPGASLPSPEPRYWSSCIGADGSPGQRRFPQARELETQVKQRAGLNTNKYWIKRLPGGDGLVENTGDTIHADRFPVFLLDEKWANDEEQQRAHEYIEWISPSLLTLQHLDNETRARIERNLNVQAVSIEHHWHLYPEIINQKLLKAARVQSKIEKSSRKARKKTGSL